ncbi:hypothetical protein Tco_0756482 [Tanacetum coccineum]
MELLFALLHSPSIRLKISLYQQAPFSEYEWSSLALDRERKKVKDEIGSPETRLNYEVIMNCDAPAVTSASAEGPIPPKTAKQKLARKNELKVKNTLLLAIPDEHLLKFHGIKDAKTLWEATKASYLLGRCKSEVAEKSTIILEQY